MEKLKKCVEKRKMNYSQSREVIYKILRTNDECLSVANILKISLNYYPKKISINTIYRHLKFFMDCELIFTLQDDLKKAYYCLHRDRVDIFEICPRCNKIKKIDLDICKEIQDIEFITLHKKCKNCIKLKRIELK